jgi:hypothetical protein
MSLHDDLLKQAWMLVEREPRRPRQASLRRAVSAAYYSLFHLLIDAATRESIRGEAAAILRALAARGFEHREMKQASKRFASGLRALPAHLAHAVGSIFPADLSLVAKAFVALQDARHAADYDLSRRFTRSDARDYVQQATDAFCAWELVKGHRAARVYLVALLLDGRLGRSV